MDKLWLYTKFIIIITIFISFAIYFSTSSEFNIARLSKSEAITTSINSVSKPCSDLAVSIFPKFQKRLEPSDVEWNMVSGDTFYIVSDNGKILELDINGNLMNKWKLGKNFDLEGILTIPSKQDIVFLGIEYPAQIIEYSLSTKKIIKTWDLQSFIDKQPSGATGVENGIESIAYIPSNKSNYGGFFYAGRQVDAKVFVFELDDSIDSPVYRGWFQAPGPNFDLSAMTVWRGKIWFLYDKALMLLSLSLNNSKLYPSQQQNKFHSESFTGNEVQETLTFNTRGQEGIAFGVVNGVDYTIVAIDPPSGKGRKDILKYKFEDFISCYKNGNLRR